MDTRPRSIPWYDWKEWKKAFHLLYNEDSKEQWKGINLVNIWRCRSNGLPVAVDATAELLELLFHIESNQNSSLNSNDNSSIWSNFRSNQELRLAASLSIIRLVNGLVDKEQKNEYARSVNSLAQSLNLPRWLVDIRHKGTHNDLPSIDTLKVAMQLSLDWLFTNYWKYQEDELGNFINSICEECSMIANTIYNTVLSNELISKQNLVQITKSLLNKMSVHDCTYYFIPILTGTLIENTFIASNSFIISPCPIKATDLFVQNWILFIQYFSTKYTTFSALIMKSILNYIENHSNIEDYNITILNQFLYKLCTNEHISIINKSYIFNPPSNTMNSNKLKHLKTVWNESIASLSILSTLSYPLKELTLYLYQSNSSVFKPFTSFLKEQNYISTKKACILQDLSIIREDIYSTIDLSSNTYNNNDKDISKIELHESDTSTLSTNPFISEHFYKYKNYIESSKPVIHENTIQISSWTVSHDVNTLPIGSIIE